MMTNHMGVLARLVVAVGALLLLAVDVVYAKQILRQIHVITRHGETTPLSHGTLTPEVDDRSKLTPNGERQHYELGIWLRNRYLAGNAYSKFDATRVRFESSNFQRTIASASSLALGLYPKEERGAGFDPLVPETPANIPIYTLGKDDNDITTRAYVQCDAFIMEQNQLFASEQWRDFESSHKDLLTRLPKYPAFQNFAGPDGSIPLNKLWLVYDALRTEQIECHMDKTTEGCNALPFKDLMKQVGDDDWARIKVLVEYAEARKYGLIYNDPHQIVNGKLIGSNMVNQIVQRMSADPTIKDPTDTTKMDQDTRFYVSSAHFPTILGIFAALELPFVHGQGEVIPGYGAALILELYQDDTTNERNVMIHYKTGEESVPTKGELDGPCNKRPMCAFSDFLHLVRLLDIPTTERWCQTCDNARADVCLASGMKPKNANNNVQFCQVETETVALIAMFGGIGVGSVFAVVAVVIFFRRNKFKMQERMQLLEVQPHLSEDGSEQNVLS